MLKNGQKMPNGYKNIYFAINYKIHYGVKVSQVVTNFIFHIKKFFTLFQKLLNQKEMH